MENQLEAFKSRVFTAIGQRNSSYNVHEDYRKIQLIPRADFARGNDIAQSYYYYRIMDPKNFQNDPKFKYVKLISDEKKLKPYMNEGFLKIIHQYPNLDLGKNVESKTIKLNGEQKYIKTIEYKIGDGSLVCDIPLLNPEAINILYEIVRRTKNNMPAANSSDPYESYEETKNSFISLESALRAGDTESYAAAGYTFVIRGVESAVVPLRAAISELTQEIRDDAKNGKSYNESLFDVKDLGENKIAIVVRMPKVTSVNSAEPEVLPKESKPNGT